MGSIVYSEIGEDKIKEAEKKLEECIYDTKFILDPEKEPASSMGITIVAFAICVGIATLLSKVGFFVIDAQWRTAMIVSVVISLCIGTLVDMRNGYNARTRKQIISIYYQAKLMEPGLTRIKDYVEFSNSLKDAESGSDGENKIYIRMADTGDGACRISFQKSGRLEKKNIKDALLLTSETAMQAGEISVSKEDAKWVIRGESLDFMWIDLEYGKWIKEFDELTKDLPDLLNKNQKKEEKKEKQIDKETKAKSRMLGVREMLASTREIG